MTSSPYALFVFASCQSEIRPVNLWVQFFAAHLPARQFLDGRAMFSWDGAAWGLPLADCALGYAKQRAESIEADFQQLRGSVYRMKFVHSFACSWIGLAKYRTAIHQCQEKLDDRGLDFLYSAKHHGKSSTKPEL